MKIEVLSLRGERREDRREYRVMSATPSADVLKQHQYVAMCMTCFGIMEKKTMGTKDLNNCASIDYPKHVQLYLKSPVTKPNWLTQELMEQKSINSCIKFDGGEIWRKFKEGKLLINNIWGPAFASFLVNNILPSGLLIPDVLLKVIIYNIVLFVLFIIFYIQVKEKVWIAHENDRIKEKQKKSTMVNRSSISQTPAEIRYDDHHHDISVSEEDIVILDDNIESSISLAQIEVTESIVVTVEYPRQMSVTWSPYVELAFALFGPSSLKPVLAFCPQSSGTKLIPPPMTPYLNPLTPEQHLEEIRKISHLYEELEYDIASAEEECFLRGMPLQDLSNSKRVRLSTGEDAEEVLE